jgi:hypothetical protein
MRRRLKVCVESHIQDEEYSANGVPANRPAFSLQPSAQIPVFNVGHFSQIEHGVSALIYFLDDECL